MELAREGPKKAEWDEIRHETAKSQGGKTCTLFIPIFRDTTYGVYPRPWGRPTGRTIPPKGTIVTDNLDGVDGGIESK